MQYSMTKNYNIEKAIIDHNDFISTANCFSNVYTVKESYIN